MTNDRIAGLLKKASQPRQLLATPEQTKQTKQSKAQTDTAGPAWFNLPAPKMTPELERDLRLLSMRSAIDPKAHYKNGVSVRSKYFQVGTVVADPSGFYADRIPRKKRATTLVDTLLKDDARRSYLKRKFSQVQETTRAGSRPSRGRSHVKGKGTKSSL